MPSSHDYAALSDDVYGGLSPADLGWQRQLAYSAHNGFHCTVYLKKGGNDVVVAFRGTEPPTKSKPDPRDLVEDLLFGVTGFIGGVVKAHSPFSTNKNPLIGGATTQMASALMAFSSIKAKFSKNTISATGHSLGGILVQTICHYHSSVVGVTFNTAGHGALIPFLKKPQLVHFCTIGDPLSSLYPNFEGKVHKISVGASGAMEKHSIKNMRAALAKHSKGKIEPLSW